MRKNWKNRNTVLSGVGLIFGSLWGCWKCGKGGSSPIPMDVRSRGCASPRACLPLPAHGPGAGWFVPAFLFPLAGCEGQVGSQDPAVSSGAPHGQGLLGRTHMVLVWARGRMLCAALPAPVERCLSWRRQETSSKNSLWIAVAS